MKCLAKTTDSFILLTPYQLEVIESDRYYCVTVSAFTHARALLKQIEIVLSGLPDEATDEDWLSFLKECEGDIELACAAFKASFEPVEAPATDEATTEETSAKRGRRK